MINIDNCRYGVMDAESRLSSHDVGGWSNAHKMGVSIAVLYDSLDETFHVCTKDTLPQMIDRMMDMDFVVGYNIDGFDRKLLSGSLSSSWDDNLRDLVKTVDLIKVIHHKTNEYVSLDRVAQACLGTGKTGNGLKAIKLWNEQRMEELIQYCTDDVELTHEIFKFAIRKHHLLFKTKNCLTRAIAVSYDDLFRHYPREEANENRKEQSLTGTA